MKVAASPRIYMGAMPESGIQVTSPQSLATHPCFHTSGFWWRLRCILDDGIPVSSAFLSRGRQISSGYAAIDGSGRSCSSIRYLTYDVSLRSG